VAYETYFDNDDSSCQAFALRRVDASGNPTFPNAASTYASLW
jgi:hypothetical protein